MSDYDEISIFLQNTSQVELSLWDSARLHIKLIMSSEGIYFRSHLLIFANILNAIVEWTGMQPMHMRYSVRGSGNVWGQPTICWISTGISFALTTMLVQLWNRPSSRLSWVLIS